MGKIEVIDDAYDNLSNNLASEGIAAVSVI